MKDLIIDERRFASQRGQTFLIIAVFIALFLLGVMGLATDYGQVWAHRQIVQAAADAACEAGAADLLLQYQDPTVSTAYPQVKLGWIGSDFNCSANTDSSPCKYAALNGYSGSNVSVSFPRRPASAPVIPARFGTIAHPYIQVSIIDPVPMYFTRLISSNRTFNIAAKAVCGMVAVNAPVPVTVLSPTADSSLSQTGPSSIVIYGGPQKSIEVNSHSSSALSGGGGIDLSDAGPNFSGGDIGVFGGPATNPGVRLGASGHFLSPSAPIGDPFASVLAVSPAGMPVQPSGGIGTVPYGTNGCPDSAGCTQYLPGNYTGGLSVKAGTAIFDPGVYYVNTGFALQPLSNVRPSAKNATTAPYGTVFYLTGCNGSPPNCLSVAATSGTGNGGGDDFALSRLTCPSGGPAYTAPPGVTPATTGNILLAPCTGPYGTSSGQYRGILFFVDRSTSGATASWNGGGTFTLAGAFYAHNLGSYNDAFTVLGTPASNSLVIGNLVVDTLPMSGNSGINMQLNPNATYPVLKVELLQ